MVKVLFFLFSLNLFAKEIIYINSTKKTNNTKKIDIVLIDKKEKEIKKVDSNSPKESNSSKRVDKNSTKKYITPAKKTLQEFNLTKAVKIKAPDTLKKLKLLKEIDSNPTKIDSNSTTSKKILHQKLLKQKEQPLTQTKAQKRVKKEPKTHNFKPVIVIIIDDVSNYSQIKKIKSLPFKVTPSIFPPSNMSENTPKLTKYLNGHYLIHLPLQSHLAKMNRFRNTLMVYDSKEKIVKRVKEIRKLFPKAKFINNHTGSTFTANYKASKMLYEELIKNRFIFIDSKTTGKSKIKKIAKEFNRAYIKRDIFLDNTQSLSYILNQLKKGIKIAKKIGYAIVIGHPHPATFQALKEAKEILKGVNVLYIDEFYRWRFR